MLEAMLWYCRKEFSSEAEISENYCATNSGPHDVELRFYPWLILFKC